MNRLLWSVAALILLAPAAGATVLVPTDLGALARDAQTIVRGTIDGIDGRWAADHHGIETVVTLHVESPLKGDPGATIRFVVPGGHVEHYRTFFVGAPGFRVGEQVIVFLARKDAAMPYVLGLSQGVYRVIEEADGRTVVTPPPLLPVASTTTIARGERTRVPTPLADFEQQVRQLATGGAR